MRQIRGTHRVAAGNMPVLRRFAHQEGNGADGQSQYKRSAAYAENPLTAAIGSFTEESEYLSQPDLSSFAGVHHIRIPPAK